MKGRGLFFLFCLAVVCFGRGPNSIDTGVVIWWSVADSVWADSCGSTDECTYFLTSSYCNIVDAYWVWGDETVGFGEDGIWADYYDCTGEDPIDTFAGT